MDQNEADRAVCDEDWRLRAEGARLLASSNSQKFAGVLARLLDDPDIAVIEATAEALLRHGGDFGMTLVLRRLADSDEQVSQAILWTLWPLEDTYGIPVRDVIGRVQAAGDPVARRGAEIALEWRTSGNDPY